MQPVYVNLHTHEQTASPDSQTSISEMMLAYEQFYRGPVMIGFVGHDDVGHNGIPQGQTPCNATKGVEHTIDKSQGFHIIEYKQFNFKVLAHPRYTWGPNCKQKALQVIQDRNLDAVEKFRAGQKQYEGRLPVLELAGDDAHNPYQIGSSYMEVMIDERYLNNMNWQVIFDQIHAGDYKLVNNPKGVKDRVLGQVQKGLSLMNNR